MNGEFSFKWSIKVMEAQLQMPPKMPSWAVVTHPFGRSRQHSTFFTTNAYNGVLL